MENIAHGCSFYQFSGSFNIKKRCWAKDDHPEGVECERENSCSYWCKGDNCNKDMNFLISKFDSECKVVGGYNGSVVRNTFLDST